MGQFTDLAWELSVLSRSVAYNNLSSAALHVGLSQPQLSRIVSKIEQNLDIALLDRSSKRKSGWTPIAFKIAELYSISAHQMDIELQKASQASELKQIRVGTLEGLIPLSMEFTQTLSKEGSLEFVQLDVHDLDSLEEKFLHEHLDFVFTIREPSRKKYNFIKSVGTQHMQWIDSNPKYAVMSPFEFGTQPKRGKVKAEKVLISNSLEIRKQWLQKFGGQGRIPSEPQKDSKRPPKDGANEVLLIGSELLPVHFWEKAVKII